MIYGMKADELYAYVFTMIMIFYIMDMKLKSRGENFSTDAVDAMSDVEVSPLSEADSKMPKQIAQGKHERKMR